jgi:DNA polymerase-3 subunit epsilon
MMINETKITVNADSLRVVLESLIAASVGEPINLAGDVSLAHLVNEYNLFAAGLNILPDSSVEKIEAVALGKSIIPDIEGSLAFLAQSDDFKVLRKVSDAYDFSDSSVAKSTKIGIGCVIDTETTGADVSVDAIVELGMVKFEFDQETGRVLRILDSYNEFDDPGIPISAEATAVNGITDEMVAGCKIDDEKVMLFTSDCDIIIAHNSAFDRPFLEKRFPFFAGLNFGCSLVQIDWAEQGYGSAKLDYLAFKMGFFYEAHRAKIDCLALLMVLSQKNNQGNYYLKAILDKLRSKSYKVSAAGAPFELKDELKKRHYRWDEKVRVWHVTVSGDDAIKSEVVWLRESIYKGRTPVLPFEIFDAKSLFSARGGVCKSKSIAADEPVQADLLAPKM